MDCFPTTLNPSLPLFEPPNPQTFHSPPHITSSVVCASLSHSLSTPMAMKQIAMALVLVAMAAAAVDAAGGKDTDCMTLVVQQMAGCVPFVTNSTVDKPTSDCCSGLKTVLKAKPACLCHAFTSGSEYGISVNVSKALTLPALCQVHAPSVTKCAAISPAAAPGVSPGANPPMSGGMSGVVTPAAAPAQKGSSSSIQISVAMLLSLIMGVFFSSF